MDAYWQHGTRDYDPAADGDEEAWARAVALEGWRTWHPSGVWVEVNGRRVRRWALRRPCFRPGSVHDHRRQCVEVLGTPGAASVAGTLQCRHPRPRMTWGVSSGGGH